jgi:hypothetical protein
VPWNLDISCRLSPPRLPNATSASPGC